MKLLLFFFCSLFAIFVVVNFACNSSSLKSEKPHDAESHYLLGKSCATSGDFKAMNIHFETSLQQSPKFNSEISKIRDKYWFEQFNAGVENVKQQQYQNALADFNNAITINANGTAAYKNMAFCYFYSNDIANAIKYYNKVLDIDQHDVTTLQQLGTLYFDQKKYQQSVNCMKKILAIHSADTQAMQQLALGYDFMGNYNQALKGYTNAIAHDSSNPDLYFNRGRLYYKRKDYQSAIQEFQKVLELNASDREAKQLVTYISHKLTDDAK